MSDTKERLTFDVGEWGVWVVILIVAGAVAIGVAGMQEEQARTQSIADTELVKCTIEGNRVSPIGASPERKRLDMAANTELFYARVEWDDGVRDGPFPRKARGCP